MRQIQNVYLEQQQKLFMTPELRQAIGILQMSTLELYDHIQSEMEENPILEEIESKELDNLDKPPNTEEKVNIKDLVDFFNDCDSRRINNEKESNEKENFLENYLRTRPSLYEHLKFQLDLEVEDRQEKLIGKYLIGNIDGNGYLCADSYEVSKRLNVDIAKVEKVLNIIKTFHPHGVGACTLQQCLLIQLKHYGKESTLAEKIISTYIEDFAKGKLNFIASELSVSVKKVQQVCDLIKTLDPKPGLQYYNEKATFIRPDVSVIKDGDRYLVIMNDLNIPHLKLSQYYMNILRQSDGISDDTKSYLEKKMESAIGLMRSIEQRRMNIFKVVQCLVDIQKDFFEKGVEYLKPLTMGMVADIVEIHESTVSRVARNKYVETPRGIFEIKYFFNSGVTSLSESSKVCSKSVKHMIQEIVNNENSEEPLSDHEITDILENKGIKISRRTVNKYRLSLGIPSVNSRKRY